MQLNTSLLLEEIVTSDLTSLAKNPEPLLSHGFTSFTIDLIFAEGRYIWKPIDRLRLLEVGELPKPMIPLYLNKASNAMLEVKK